MQIKYHYYGQLKISAHYLNIIEVWDEVIWALAYKINYKGNKIWVMTNITLLWSY